MELGHTLYSYISTLEVATVSFMCVHSFILYFIAGMHHENRLHIRGLCSLFEIQRGEQKAGIGLGAGAVASNQ
jgi:hypothetical protein